jgi:hypothetical protein
MNVDWRELKDGLNELVPAMLAKYPTEDVVPTEYREIWEICKIASSTESEQRRLIESGVITNPIALEYSRASIEAINAPGVVELSIITDRVVAFLQAKANNLGWHWKPKLSGVTAKLEDFQCTPLEISAAVKLPLADVEEVLQFYRLI